MADKTITLCIRYEAKIDSEDHRLCSSACPYLLKTRPEPGRGKIALPYASAECRIPSYGAQLLFHDGLAFRSQKCVMNERKEK